MKKLALFASLAALAGVMAACQPAPEAAPSAPDSTMTPSAGQTTPAPGAPSAGGAGAQPAAGGGKAPELQANPNGNMQIPPPKR